jgi:hypothetical protein
MSTVTSDFGTKRKSQSRLLMSAIGEKSGHATAAVT